MKIPEEVATFLREIADVRDEKLSINPLSPEESARQTEQWQKTSLAGVLGLVVLDDASNSDPYGYVTRGLTEGMVVHFPHDGVIKVAFPDLASFGAALRQAVADRTHIEDLPHAKIPPLADQAGLAAKLRGWVASDEATKDRDVHAENEHSIAQHLPLLDPADVETLRAVAESRNFLISETAAHFIEANPRPAHVPIAELLAVHGHGQVAMPARRALVALGAPQPPLTPKQEKSMPLPDRDAVGMVFSLVERPSGAFRLTMDFVRREGDAPSFTWRTTRDYAFERFSAEQIEEYEGLQQTKIPVEELARISRMILGQLFWQRKEGRTG